MCAHAVLSLLHVAAAERALIMQRLRVGSAMPPPLPSLDTEVARLTEDVALEVRLAHSSLW